MTVSHFYLFTTSGCHLCEQAEVLLKPVMNETRQLHLEEISESDDLMSKYGLRPQMVLTTPLLEGIDAKMENGVVVGKKMSKSADNYIALNEPPIAMFRKVMQIDDEVIFRYFELLSARYFSIDLQGRILNGAYDSINNHVTGFSIGVGINWF